MNSPVNKSIRVLLIDDSPIIRLGLRSALEDCPDITIVGEAGTAAAGLEALTRLKPDAVLLDLHLPDKSGLLVCREIVKMRPGLPVLILTSSNSERHMRDAIAAGAKGYLLKENDSVALATALRTVMRGDSVLDPAMAGQMLHDWNDSAGEQPVGLGAAQRHDRLHGRRKGAITDHAVRARGWNVEYRCAIDVDAERREIGRQQAAIEPAGHHRRRRIAGVELTEDRGGRRQAPVRRPQPLHAPAFLVDQHRRVVATHRVAHRLHETAYLVGRLLTNGPAIPFLLALRNPPQGIVVDAVLLTEDEVSIVFSFARSYFLVAHDRPRELVDYLRMLMPRKPLS